jgi:hypothetical protein
MCGRVAQRRDPNYYGSILKVDWTKGVPNALLDEVPEPDGAPEPGERANEGKPEREPTNSE